MPIGGECIAFRSEPGPSALPAMTDVIASENRADWFAQPVLLFPSQVMLACAGPHPGTARKRGPGVSTKKKTFSNKKLVVTSATLVVTGALLVVTRSY